MKHIDLFSGIGGFALAVDTIWPNSEHIFCEIDPFCQKILAKHWPNSQIYGDIRTLAYSSIEGRREMAKQRKQDKENLNAHRSGGQFDILTGGFPCQPFSHAGQRRGTEDNRFLWPEMLRVIRDFNPTWVIAENVGGILTIEDGLVFEQVCSDLESAGYDVQAFIIPACAVNAPHRRDRVWFVAHSINGRPRGEERGSDGKKSEVQKEYRKKDSPTGQPIRTIGNRKDDGHAPDSDDAGFQGDEQPGTLGEGEGTPRSITKRSWDQNWTEIAAWLCGVDDGLPVELDGFKLSRSQHRTKRLKALGNAIVPQVAMQIMNSIKSIS